MTVFAWMHSDDRGGAQATAQALARAKARAWDPGLFAGSYSGRVEDLRALIAATAVVNVRLADPVVLTERDGVLWLPDLATLTYASPERAWAASLLTTTWVLLAEGRLPSKQVVETRGGIVGDAGAWPAAVLGVVSRVAAAAALIYCAEYAAEVIDRHLRRSTEADDREAARRARMGALLESQAVAIEVIDRHQQREKEAGQTLPLDAASKAVLEQLERSQTALTTPEPPMPPEPPLGPSTCTAFPWLALAAGLGLALFLFKDDK